MGSSNRFSPPGSAYVSQSRATGIGIRSGPVEAFLNAAMGVAKRSLAQEAEDEEEEVEGGSFSVSQTPAWPTCLV